MTNRVKGIDWNVKGTKRIAQNVLNLINTYQYEVAYNRIMGIPAQLTDAPSSYVIAQLNQEIFEIVSRFEPRATVKKVDCGTDESGDISIEVVIEL